MMKSNEALKTLFIFTLCCISFLGMEAQVTLSTDFTSDTDKKEALHEIWDVANRISPQNGSNVRVGTDINLVRMIGGIVKKVDGVKVPDLDYDPVSYDSINHVYVYNWEPLISRLSKIVNGQTKIHQLVLDQVPWAFQHGYEFIPEGTTDNIHFREDERVSIYGNSLPAADKEAYHAFIKAMIEKLVDTFGEEEVMSWRFRVGSEIETPDHWFGTKEDFINHFANTEKAVRSVLPDAKIGLHTRTPGFVYKSGVPKNYKGEPFASFVDGLIEYCADSSVQYDFWGISDYVLINGEKYRDLSTKYDDYFKDMQEHPKWNADCTLDMMEYSTVIEMNPPDGGVYLNCATSHKDLIELGLSHMFLRKGIDKIFRWGLRTSGDLGPIDELRQMVGQVRYETTLSGSPKTSSNQLDAIYAKNATGYDVIVYNNNANSLNYVADEAVSISFTTDLPVGDKLYYRNNTFGREQNKLQQFLLKEGSSTVMSEWDEKGDPSRTLTDAGYEKYQAFTDFKTIVFNEWKSVVTVPRTDGGTGSMVLVEADIASFSYKKFEFRLESDFVTAIAPTKVLWTSSDDFYSWASRTSGMDVNTDNDKLTLTFSEGAGFPMAGVTDLNIKADLFETMRMVIKNSTPEASLQIAVNAPGTSFIAGRSKPAISNDNLSQEVEVDLANWALWTGVISDFKLYSKVNSGVIEIDTIEFVPSASGATVEVTVEQEGLGLVNYSSGTCFAGQEFEFSAIAEPGWMFVGWTGDVSSSANPLTVKIDSAMTVKAVFAFACDFTIEKVGNGTVSHSSGVYAEGEEFALVATPDAGWIFSGWTGDTLCSESSLNITLNKDYNVRANFIQVFYDLTLLKEGLGSLSYGSGAYIQGEFIVLEATPSSGWVFSGWTGDTVSAENPLTISIDSSMNIKANFVEKSSGVDDNLIELARIYPNPSSNGIFNIDVPVSQRWNVYDLTGVKVQSGVGDVVDLSSCHRGMYLFVMNNSVIKLLFD